MKTRQYIVEATSRMILSKGLARLTNKEIAEAAGCAEGTLYKHFSSKEELILAAIAENLPHFIEVIQGNGVGQRTIEENLQDVARAAIRYYEKLLPLTTSLFADMELVNSFRQWLREQQVGPLALYERVAVYIEAEQRLGRLNQSIRPFSFAALLLGPCHQYASVRHFQGYDPFPLPEEQFITELVEGLLQGGAPHNDHEKGTKNV